ncbi:unnamed protein product [Hermetia illucens]|uniref:Uncharacterized protein n=1 Tax=Hermetia illucens TaxID=343691 RepID=A0A7R8V495_HERIL|nr:centrosomal protein of 164 kDa-like [Hermetia illucens]CAD7092581.1 unnamed protein product [Hermetia illucens]
MSNRKSTDVFTPRRSLRISKLEMSMKEEDLRTSLGGSAVASRTPRRPTLKPTNDEEERLSGPQSSEEHSSGGLPKNQKKRNKKSKKQKAKANQKRKQAKKLQTQDSNSDNAEEVQESKGSDEASESGVDNSPVDTNMLDDAEGEAPLMETVPSPVGVDMKPDGTNEISECADAVDILSHSPISSSTDREKVIDLVTPDLMQSESFPTIGNSPQKHPESDAADGEELPEEAERVLEETFELPHSETGLAEESACITDSDADNASEKATRMKSSVGEPRYSSTPAKRSLERRSTPLKPVTENSVEKVRTSDVALATPKQYILVTPLSANQPTKTPLKSALRRSRRSMSVDTGLNTTAKKGVMFHSPSNTTILIDEVDSIMKSKKKQPAVDGEEEEGKYVSVRRKRSLSLAETEDEKEFIKQLQPNNVDASHAKNTKRDPTPSSRVKLPNFAAIHQQQFEKMESIWDHVARKTERAKVLSSSKPKEDKSNLKGSQKKEVKQPGEATRPTAAPPKARQRIELSNIKVSNDVASKTGTKVLPNPNPKEDKEKLNGSLKKDVKRLNAPPKPINVPFKPRQGVTLSNNHATKPVLSKAIKTVALEARKKTLTTTKSTKPTEVEENKPRATTAPLHKTITAKPADRQKDHMSMYKSSGHSVSTILQDERKEQKGYVTGVRSNRRFMLQMQHRDRIK